MSYDILFRNYFYIVNSNIEAKINKNDEMIKKQK